jgi:hypothetical protein
MDGGTEENGDWSGDMIRILKNPFPVYRGLRGWKWRLPSLLDCFTRYMRARRDGNDIYAAGL